MKKIVIILILGCILTGCQKTPDSEIEDGVLKAKRSTYSVETAQNEFDTQSLPESFKTNISYKDCILEIDADIVMPNTEITKGTVLLSNEPTIAKISEVLFDNKPLSPLVADSSGSILGIEGTDIYAPDTKSFSLTDISGLKQYVFEDNSLSSYFSVEAKPVPISQYTENQLEFINSYEDLAQDYLNRLKLNHVINNSVYYDGENPYVYCETVNELNGVKCCTSNVLGGKPDINCSGYMDISDKGLSQFVIFSDFYISESKKCSMITWNGVLETLEILVNQQGLRRIADAPPITHIELKYLIEEENGIFSYCPVWSFEAYQEVFFRVLPVFAINAETAELEFINSNY